MAYGRETGQGPAPVIPEAPLVRAVPVLALVAIALVACKAQPPKAGQTAASSAPAPSSAPAAPAPAAPQHNWASRNGDEYAYGPDGGDQTIVRYLGSQDGVYAVAEVAGGQVVVASCAKPCDTVRVRGKGLDQTLPLNPNSTVYAALSDAMNGQLDVYKMPAASARKTAPPQ